MHFDRSIQRESVFAVKDGPPSETVIRALNEVEERDLRERPPLYEEVDPEALDSLFRGPNPGTVSFEYGEYTVVVREGTEVIVAE